MALSQAQSSVKQLTSELEQAGRNVEFAIHPVAGRMPGHMNVLLAEVDIPYDKLHEMDDINDDFKDADVALVIGANASSIRGQHSEGADLRHADPQRRRCEEHHHLQFRHSAGYAGVDNPLYDEEENTHAVLVLGDAKTLSAVSPKLTARHAKTTNSIIGKRGIKILRFLNTIKPPNTSSHGHDRRRSG